MRQVHLRALPECIDGVFIWQEGRAEFLEAVVAFGVHFVQSPFDVLQVVGRHLAVVVDVQVLEDAPAI